jgi:hypothetical protein
MSSPRRSTMVAATIGAEPGSPDSPLIERSLQLQNPATKSNTSKSSAGSHSDNLTASLASSSKRIALPKVHMSALNFPTYTDPDNDDPSSTSAKPKPLTTGTAKKTKSKALTVKKVDFGPDNEEFAGILAKDLEWDDLSIEKGDNGKMVVYKIGDKKLEKGKKAAPGIAYLKQAMKRFEIGMSNPTKPKILEELGETKANGLEADEWANQAEKAKTDDNAIIIRLINIVFSDEFYGRYSTLDDQLHKNEMNRKIKNSTVRDTFWTDVHEEYNNTTPNPEYDLTHYSLEHQWFDDIDPSNTWPLASHKVVYAKWQQLRREYARCKKNRDGSGTHTSAYDSFSVVSIVIHI